MPEDAYWELRVMTGVVVVTLVQLICSQQISLLNWPWIWKMYAYWWILEIDLVYLIVISWEK